MILDQASTLAALHKGKVTLQGQFISGSNYTFLVDVSESELKFTAVYKPLRGEQPLWDFPPGTLCKREVAAYVVSELLGWELVPPTVYRRQRMPLGAGSLQLYIEHDPDYHYFNFSDEDRQRLQPVALFDCLVNNADRKGSHILKDRTGHLWLIDHGICFHVEEKLRTVVWDFSGEPIPDNLLCDLQRFCKAEEEESISRQLDSLLRPSEIAATFRRANQLIRSGVFPAPTRARRSYPWPPV